MQSILRTPRLLAFLGERDIDVVSVRIKLQNHLHGRYLVFRAKNDRLLAGAEIPRLSGVRRPFGQRSQIEMRQTVLDQDFHPAT